VAGGRRGRRGRARRAKLAKRAKRAKKTVIVGFVVVINERRRFTNGAAPRG
jgi:hypothetical protein